MARTRGAKDKKPRKRKVYGVWFEGRRTAIVRSADSRSAAIGLARKAKRRGGDRVVSARPLKGSSLRAAEAGRWTRERARPGDDQRLRGFGPKPKSFAASDRPVLATFGRGPDRRPRKRRRGVGAGLAAAGLSSVALTPLGAAIATARPRSDVRVDRTINRLTQQPRRPFLADLDDAPPEVRREAIRQEAIRRAAGGSPDAEQLYREIAQNGKASPEQVKQLKKLGRKNARQSAKALRKGLVRRFATRKALIGAGVGAGVALGAGAIYGLGRKRERSYYDYYDY